MKVKCINCKKEYFGELIRKYFYFIQYNCTYLSSTVFQSAPALSRSVSVSVRYRTLFQRRYEPWRWSVDSPVRTFLAVTDNLVTLLPLFGQLNLQIARKHSCFTQTLPCSVNKERKNCQILYSLNLRLHNVVLEIVWRGLALKPGLTNLGLT